MQRLVCVDVAQAGNEGLIQEQRFEKPPPSVQYPVKLLSSEIPAERLGTEALGHRFRILSEPNTTELARVVESQTGDRTDLWIGSGGRRPPGRLGQEHKNQAIVLLRSPLSRSQLQVAAHPEVDQQTRPGKSNMQEFRSAAYVLYELSLDLAFEAADRWSRYGPCPPHVSLGNLATDKRRQQSAGYGFDFREFRHPLHSPVDRGFRGAAVPTIGARLAAYSLNISPTLRPS